jgi:hypothetical protein
MNSSADHDIEKACLAYGLTLKGDPAHEMKAYILAALFIADNPAQPRWAAGDKYEAAWKDLYSMPK